MANNNNKLENCAEIRQLLQLAPQGGPGRGFDEIPEKGLPREFQKPGEQLVFPETELAGATNPRQIPETGGCLAIETIEPVVVYRILFYY